MNTKETWIWTELLAFDCEAEDCGVGAYLERLGFVPTGISLLVSSIDFVLLHRGFDEGDYTLFPDVCSRFGHAGNEERQRQEWSALRLKALADALHTHGIKVFFSVFITNMENRFHEEFVSRHPEIRMGDKIYGIDNLVSPLAELNDGTLLDDLLAAKILEVVRDYGFDGWHAADGQGPGWNLSHSDCSDGFVRQFARWLGPGRLEASLLESADHDQEKMSARIDAIWQNHQAEWAAFTSIRWLQFYKKVTAGLHGIGREVMINSPFAKSVFESIFYFGLDYRGLLPFEIDYLLTESVTTSCSLNYGMYERVFDFSAMIAEMRAVLPGMKVIVMPGVKDVVESYDALRHAPCRLERDVFCNLNQSIWRQGRAERAADGWLVCLGDGITREEWGFLRKLEAMAFGFDFDWAGDLAWLVSPKAFDALETDYRLHGTWTPYMQTAELVESQALDISCAVRPDDLDSLDRPLLVPSFDLLDEPLRARILAREALTVLLGNADGLPSGEGLPGVFCRIAPDVTMGCVVLNGKGGQTRLPDAVPEKPFDWRPTFCGYIRNRIPRIEIPGAFWNAVGALVRENLPESPLKNPEEGIRMMRFFRKDGETLAILSLRDIYKQAKVAPGEPVAALDKRSGFPYSGIQLTDGILTLSEHRSPLHLPPQGITVIDVQRTHTN